MDLSPYQTTVVTEPDSTDMTVLATVKDELNITDGASDGKLARGIRQASAAIVRYLNRDLAQATVTDTFRGNRGVADWAAGLLEPIESLWLSRSPVTTVTSIVEDGTTLETADYELDAATGQLWRLDGNDCRSLWRGARIDVTYSGGYVMVTDLPEDLEQAAIRLVTANWFKQGRDPLVKSETVPGVLSVDYWVGGTGDNGAIPPDVAALLDPFRRIPV